MQHPKLRVKEQRKARVTDTTQVFKDVRTTARNNESEIPFHSVSATLPPSSVSAPNLHPTQSSHQLPTSPANRNATSSSFPDRRRLRVRDQRRLRVRDTVDNTTMAGGSKRRSTGIPNPPASKVRRTESTSRRPTPANSNRNPPMPTSQRSADVGLVPQQEEGALRGRERSSNDDDIVSLFPADIKAVTMIVNAAETRLVKQINILHRKLIQEVKGNEIAIQELSTSTAALVTNVSKLNVLTLQNSAAIARQQSSNKAPGRTRKRNGKTELEEEVESKFPTIVIELPSVFGSHIFCHAAARCISSYMDSCHRVKDDVRTTPRSLSVVLFGLQRDRLLQDFKKGIGRLHAKFRHKIAVAATRDALRITDSMFRIQEQEVLADIMKESPNGTETAERLLPASRKPEWLTARVLTKDVLEHARVFHQCIKSEHIPLPTDPKQRRAIHMGRFIVKSVMELLRMARDRCRQKLFESGVFLLLDWKEVDAWKEEHSFPEVRFVKPSAVPIETKDVGECMTRDDPNYQVENARLLRNFIDERHEMIIEATYNVTVVIKKGRRCRPVRASLAAWTPPADAEVDTSRDHERAQRSGRDEDVENATGINNNDRGRNTGIRNNDLNSGNGGVPDDTQPEIPHISLRDILPAESETEKEMAKVLRMSIDVYNKLHISEASVARVREDDTRVTSSGDSGEDGADKDYNDLDSEEDVVDGMYD